jgi:hypothetical protein
MDVPEKSAPRVDNAEHDLPWGGRSAFRTKYQPQFVNTIEVSLSGADLVQVSDCSI